MSMSKKSMDNIDNVSNTNSIRNNLTAEDFDRLYEEKIAKEEGRDAATLRYNEMRKKSTISPSDYIMEDGTPIVDTSMKSSGRGELERKSEFFIDNYLPNKRGVSKVKEFMMDEDVKEFNKTLAKITFAKEGITIDANELFGNPNKVYNTMVTYFETCINKNIMPTIATMCAFIGCSKEELYNNAGNTNCPSYKVLSKGVMLCHSFAEMGAINGVVDSKVFSFLSKNYYGLRDDTNVNVRAGVISENDVNNVETVRAIREQIMSENDNVSDKFNDKFNDKIIIDIDEE